MCTGRVSNRTEAATQITRELLNAESGDRLQNSVVRPSDHLEQPSRGLVGTSLAKLDLRSQATFNLQVVRKIARYLVCNFLSKCDRAWSKSANGSALCGFTTSGIVQNHVGGFFGNHDGWRVGVARDDTRHDGGVRHAQPVDAPNAEPRITTAISSLPILQVPRDGSSVCAEPRIKLGDSGVRRNLRAGMQFVAAIRVGMPSCARCGGRGGLLP